MQIQEKIDFGISLAIISNRDATNNGNGHVRGMMKPAICFVSALALLLFFFGGAWGADISVLGGNVNMTISSATAGQQPDPVTNEACQLQWSTLVADPTQKITVQTNLASPSFTLAAQALNVSAGDGTAAGEVILSTTAQDFVVSIPPNVPAGDPGTCTLRYTASATAAAGTGTDTHTITYTIVNQGSRVRGEDKLGDHDRRIK